MENTCEILIKVTPGTGGDIGEIILNRCRALNALNQAMCALIHKHLMIWAQQDSIKAVIISSAEGRAFCAGGDVSAVYKTCAALQNLDQALQFFKIEYAMNQALFFFPKPYIAFLDGITMGGGVGISIHGSHAIGTEKLVWAMPETGIGFFPDVGVGFHLAKLPKNIGKFLALTGERIQAADALQLDLLQAVVASENLPILKQALVNTQFQGHDFDAVSKIIAQFHQPPQQQNLPLQQYYMEIMQHFNYQTIEQIIASLISAGSAWALKTANNLMAQSPTSLKVTLCHLQRCAEYSFEQVMVENLTLARSFLQHHDFMEGVRAAVIDKDRNPQWLPPSLSEVTPQLVEKYFLS